VSGGDGQVGLGDVLKSVMGDGSPKEFWWWFFYRSNGPKQVFGPVNWDKYPSLPSLPPAIQPKIPADYGEPSALEKLFSEHAGLDDEGNWQMQIKFPSFNGGEGTVSWGGPTFNHGHVRWGWPGLDVDVPLQPPTRQLPR
jgi:hypothetical protein